MTTRPTPRLTWHRLLLWTVLLVFAAWFLAPLYVMVATSLKDMEQVRQGSLLSWPTDPTLDAWAKAWGSACTGTDCGGLQPFFMNSVLMGLASTTLFFRNYYMGLPDELIKAAMLDGAGFFRIFWRIVLPLSTPILVVTLIWQFTNIWNDFLFGVVFSGADSKPITVGLNNLANTSSSVKEYNVDMAAAMIAALPTLFV